MKNQNLYTAQYTLVYTSSSSNEWATAVICDRLLQLTLSKALNGPQQCASVATPGGRWGGTRGGGCCPSWWGRSWGRKQQHEEVSESMMLLAIHSLTFWGRGCRRGFLCCRSGAVHLGGRDTLGWVCGCNSEGKVIVRTWTIVLRLLLTYLSNCLLARQRGSCGVGSRL